MAYFELEKAKSRCNIDPTDPSFDQLLNDFGTASDKEVDALIYEIASKIRTNFQLPVLPLPSPSQDIKDASTDRVVAKWWRKQKDYSAEKSYNDASKLAITNWILMEKVDAQVYGIIIGGPDSQFTG